MAPATVLVLHLALLLLGTGVPLLVAAVNPCEYHDGSGRVLLDLNFTESYGKSDHLKPTHKEERSLHQIYGRVRHVNDTGAAGADTVVLRMLDVLNGNKFCNKSLLYPVETFFATDIRSGVAYVRLKRGIDREKLDIYVPGMPGVTVADAPITFLIECTPSDASFAARNFTARVLINDLNDNPPAFYSGSDSTSQLASCQLTNLTQGNFTVTVRQNTPAGVLVFSGPVARDRDESLNALTRISLQPNPYFEAAVSGQQVRIFTKRQIYYDSFDESAGGVSVKLLLVAADSPANGSLQLSSTATIAFTIIDEEDLPPKFVVPGCLAYKSQCVNPTYSATVKGGVNTTTGPLSIEPGPVRAVNQDAMKSDIRYSLAAGDNVSSFWIDRDTGLVTQLRAIDRPVALVVKATKWSNQSAGLLIERYSVALLAVSVELHDISNSSTPMAAVTTAAPPRIRQATLALLLWSMIAACAVQTLVIVALLTRWLIASRSNDGKSNCSPTEATADGKSEYPAAPGEADGDNNLCDAWDYQSEPPISNPDYMAVESSLLHNSRHKFALNSIHDEDEEEADEEDDVSASGVD